MADFNMSNFTMDTLERKRSELLVTHEFLGPLQERLCDRILPLYKMVAYDVERRSEMSHFICKTAREMVNGENTGIQIYSEVLVAVLQQFPFQEGDL